MTFSRNLLTCLALSAASMAAFAAAPATNSAPAAAAPVQKQKASAGKAAPKTAATTPPATPSPTTQPSSSTGLTLDTYIKDLTAELKLSDSEKQEIENLYVDDGAALKNILNDASLSPLQQTQEVDNLRNLRNSKIAALLADPYRQRQFLQIEAAYRAALIEVAADGGFVAAPPAPAKT